MRITIKSPFRKRRQYADLNLIFPGEVYSYKGRVHTVMLGDTGLDLIRKLRVIDNRLGVVENSDRLQEAFGISPMQARRIALNLTPIKQIEPETPNVAVA